MFRVRATARVASTRTSRTARLPLRVLPERRLPALSWLPGQRPAQEAKCRCEGKRLMSVPISAKMHALRGLLTDSRDGAQGVQSLSLWQHEVALDLHATLRYLPLKVIDVAELSPVQFVGTHRG